MYNNTDNCAGGSKFGVDMSKDKYESRYDRLLNILFYSKEIPSDLYVMMNMSYDNFRKTVSILKQRKLIKTIRDDNINGYVLTHTAKKLTWRLNYMRYADCSDEQRGYDIKHRRRCRQFAYLYALFDRAGIPYERFAKPALTEETLMGDRVYFYTGLDFKRMLEVEATAFKGSRLLGFFVGKGKIIPVYRTTGAMKISGSHEALVPFLILQYFRVLVDTAVLICGSEIAQIDIMQKINDNLSVDPKEGINTADYRYFYVFPSDDSFLEHFNDMYIGHEEEEQRVIEEYKIDTANTDVNGHTRFRFGTGFVGDSQVLVCAGNVDSVKLKYFVRNSEQYDSLSYIICRQRDLDVLEEVVEGKPIKVVAV